MDITATIKKNISIIIPVAIAVVALLLFVPTLLLQGKIGKKLEESQRLGSEVRTAIDSAVPAAQLELLKSYENKRQEDANEIQKLAIQTTQRPLLSYKIFPKPNETSVQIFNEFGRLYNAAIAKLVEDMNALDAPTDAEVRKAIGSMKSGEVAPTTQRTTDRNEGSDKITELICKKRSEQIPVYAKPQVFSGYAFWNNWEYSSVESAARDCWYCQLALWIHQDIVDTIKKINSGSEKVATSPVKRLLGIRFRSPDAAEISVNSKEMPVYVTEKEPGLCISWTGRKSNDKIDVVHFSTAVIIRADDVLRFMNELCSEKTHTFSGYKNDLPRQEFKHNQITILQSSIEPVDKDAPDNERYLYGQQAIVYLNLVCEYLFNKEGYNVIEPNSAKPDFIEGSNPQLTPGRPSPSGQPSGIGY